MRPRWWTWASRCWEARRWSASRLDAGHRSSAAQARVDVEVVDPPRRPVERGEAVLDGRAAVAVGHEVELALHDRHLPRGVPGALLGQRPEPFRVLAAARRVGVEDIDLQGRPAD